MASTSAPAANKAAVATPATVSSNKKAAIATLPPVPELSYDLIRHIASFCDLRGLYALASLLNHTWLNAALEQKRSHRVIKHSGSKRRDASAELQEAPAKVSYPHSMVLLPPAFATPGMSLDFLVADQPRRLRRLLTRSTLEIFSELGDPQKEFPPAVRGSSGPSGLATYLPGTDGAHLQVFSSDTGRDVVCCSWAEASAFASLLDNDAEFGGFGHGDGQLIAPGDLCVGNGRLFVAEAHGVSAFTLSNSNRVVPTFEYKFGKHGSKEGEFKGVGGLAASNREGELYVCDTGNHRIQVHSTRDGTFLRSFGGKGDAPGQFRKPAAIAVLDPKTSSGGGGASSSSSSSSGTGLMTPASRGVRIIVGETSGKRIQVLTSTGSPLQLISMLRPPFAHEEHLTNEALIALSNQVAPFLGPEIDPHGPMARRIIAAGIADAVRGIVAKPDDWPDDMFASDGEAKEAGERFELWAKEDQRAIELRRQLTPELKPARVACFAVDEERSKVYAAGASPDAQFHVFDVL